MLAGIETTIWGRSAEKKEDAEEEPHRNIELLMQQEKG